jgi:hypothetical protein
MKPLASLLITGQLLEELLEALLPFSYLVRLCLAA